MSNFDMTPLCGFGMSEATSVEPLPRHKQIVAPAENATVMLDSVDVDAMLILTPAAPLLSITIALPPAGEDLQQWGIASMADIASLNFTGGELLNAPMELLANQAIIIQRIDTVNNKWITIL